MAINATSLNSPEDKLNWMFDVFDKDGGGTISSDEIKDLIMLGTCCLNEILILSCSGLFEMAGQEIEDEDLDTVSKDIMSTIDEDGDGDVTKVRKILSKHNFLFSYYHKILFLGGICEACTQKEISINTYPRAKVCLTTCWITYRLSFKVKFIEIL